MSLPKLFCLFPKQYEMKDLWKKSWQASEQILRYQEGDFFFDQIFWDGDFFSETYYFNPDTETIFVKLLIVDNNG